MHAYHELTVNCRTFFIINLKAGPINIANEAVDLLGR